MRILFVVLLVLVLSGSGTSAQEKWEYAESQGEPVRTCVASVDVGFITLGFKANPGGMPYGFISGANLPEQSQSTWQVNGRQGRSYNGLLDDNTGQFLFGSVNEQFLHEVAAGDQLAVSVSEAGSPVFASYGTVRAPLAGSALAIRQLWNCATGMESTPTIIAGNRVVPFSVAAPSKGPTQQAPVSEPVAAQAVASTPTYDEAMDDLTTYATILGRGMGCRIDIGEATKRVTYWMYGSFNSTTLPVAQVVMLTTTEFAANQQIAGQSPDSCGSLAGTIASFPWP